MENFIKKIDKELCQVILKSPFSKIDYENLLINDPIKIREEEIICSLGEDPLDIPKKLSVKNIKIPSCDISRKIRLRIYSPKEMQNLPVLLYFHGGAFIYGTPEQYDFTFFNLALDVQMLVVSVDYRLAPENPFPAGLQDGYDSLLWLFKNAEKIGGDKNRLIIGGSSAGATIATSIAHMVRDKKQITLFHQYLLYPATSHLADTASMKELANALMQTKESSQWMWKHYLNDKLDSPPKYAIPLLENNFRELPDTTIIVCELDPLKDEGKLYAKKLKEAGVLVNLLEIKGAVHAFDFFFMSIISKFL